MYIMEKVVIYKNGAKAIRRPDGRMKIISGPTIVTHRGKNKPKKLKGGVLTELIEPVVTAIKDMVTIATRPRVRSKKQTIEEFMNNPEYQQAKAEDIEETLSRGYKWKRLVSGKRVLINPITKQEVTNQKGEPIILNESEYTEYNKDGHVDSGGQDNKLPVMGEGLRRRRRKR